MREIGTTVLGLLVVDDEKDPVGLLLVPNGIVPLSERDDASLRDAALPRCGRISRANGIVPLPEERRCRRRRRGRIRRRPARAWRPAPRSSRQLPSAPVTAVTPVTPP